MVVVMRIVETGAEESRCEESHYKPQDATTHTNKRVRAPFRSLGSSSESLAQSHGTEEAEQQARRLLRTTPVATRKKRVREKRTKPPPHQPKGEGKTRPTSFTTSSWQQCPPSRGVPSRSSLPHALPSPRARVCVCVRERARLRV